MMVNFQLKDHHHMRLLFTLLALAPLVFPQQMDDEFAKSVKEWTTSPNS